jgi:hypothetical protein
MNKFAIENDEGVVTCVEPISNDSVEVRVVRRGGSPIISQIPAVEVMRMVQDIMGYIPGSDQDKSIIGKPCITDDDILLTLHNFRYAAGENGAKLKFRVIKNLKDSTYESLEIWSE